MIYKQFQDMAQAVPYPDNMSDKMEFKARKVEYRARQEEIRLLFKAALEKEYGTENAPKRDLLWEKAWEMGHSAGFHDVEGSYADLSDLVL